MDAILSKIQGVEFERPVKFLLRLNTNWGLVKMFDKDMVIIYIKALSGFTNLFTILLNLFPI